jgi:hypothetical protein
MAIKQPDEITGPLMHVVRSQERKAPPNPSDKGRGDSFVADVLAAKREMYSRVAERGRRQNPPAPTKPAA